MEIHSIKSDEFIKIKDIMTKQYSIYKNLEKFVEPTLDKCILRMLIYLITLDWRIEIIKIMIKL